MPWNYAGQTISQPGVIMNPDNSNDAVTANSSNRELVLIGSAGGGQPKTALTFSDPNTAKTVLQSGAGLTAVLRALNPSTDSTKAPGSVKFVRVDPATQSTLSLTNGATAVATLTSVGYGAYTNRISTQIQAGSQQGLKVTLLLDNVTMTQDNLYQAMLNIQYTGSAASGLVTVSNSAGQVQGLAGDTGAETVQWTADFATYSTIQQLVNYINSQSGWTASIVSANPNGPTANALDDVAKSDCKTAAYLISGTLGALVNWYNNTGIVTAHRAANTGLQPSVMTSPVSFSGGSTGTPTNADWANAFSALQNEPLARIIVPLTDQAAIHAMGDAHCQYMSQPTIRNNRIQIVGGALGETVSQVLSRAQNLNSRRTTLVWPGVQDIDPITQTLTTYAPYHAAAQAGAILSSLPVTNTLTHLELSSKGLEGTLQSTLQRADYDALTNGGVMAIKFIKNSLGNAYRFVRSVTTWLQDTDLVNVELSCVANEDYVDLYVGDLVDTLVGQPGSPIGVGQVTATIDGALRALYEQGVIVGDSLSKAYGDISVSLSNGAVTGSYRATIPAPMNFFGITTNYGLYSTSAAV